jgi:hypothetical protein
MIAFVHTLPRSCKGVEDDVTMAEESQKAKDGRPSSAALVVPEIVDAIKQEKAGQINVNILIQQVSESPRIRRKSSRKPSAP